MPDDLKALARAEEEELGRPWPDAYADDLVALAEGKLSEARRTELVEIAKRDPDLAAAFALYAPVDAAFVDALVDQVAAGRSRPGAPAPAAVSDLARHRQRRTRRLLASTSTIGLAAAAAITIFFTSRGRLRPLPEFEVTLTGGMADERGRDDPGAASGRRFAPDSEIDLVLRPATALTSDLAASAFVRAHGPGAARPVRSLTLPVLVSNAGAVRLAGPVARIFAGAGDRVSLIVVLQTGPDPDRALRIADGREPPGRHARRIELPLELAPGPP